MSPSGAGDTTDPFSLLTREDKWFLGNGEGMLFAPPFPVWLNTPGFWDEATIFQYSFAPAFTVAFLDESGKEIDLIPLSRRWTPAEVIVDYRLSNGMTATEVRTVQPGGVLASEWRIRVFRRARIHLVAWTAQDAADVVTDSVEWNGGLSFARELRDADGVPWTMNVDLACTAGASSWSAVLGEQTPNHPHWRQTPFVEQWHPGGLSSSIRVGALPAKALLYAAIHREVVLDGESGSATFAMRIAPADLENRENVPTALAPQAYTLGGASRRRLREWLEDAPAFRCADPYLETYFTYRWYGLALNSIEPAGECYAHPATTEGVGPLHRLNASAAECHVRELRWLDVDRAVGNVRAFFAEQRDDGSLPALIYPNHIAGSDGTTNWGAAMLALEAVLPRASLAQELYPKLAAFAEWLLRERDAAATGMIDDTLAAGRKSVAATVYAYELFRALERVATHGSDVSAALRWNELGNRAAIAVRENMWDSERQLFLDYYEQSGQREPISMASGFYPYLTDIVSADHVAGLERVLLDPRKFWTPFPVPSRAIDEPSFSGSAEIAFQDVNGDDTGRVRPFINSHVVQSLACASRLLPRLRPRATELLRRFVHMLFHDGDLQRPNCYEHYNPYTGHASVHRGIDDHQHSWVNDLIIQYLAGIRPHADGITVDPFPAGLEFLHIANVRARGRTLAVSIEADDVAVIVDGRTLQTKIGDPIEIAD